jgi:hypothetical protein
MRRSIIGKIWKGRSESLQERVQKELQMTITDSKRVMEWDKTKPCV